MHVLETIFSYGLKHIWCSSVYFWQQDVHVGLTQNTVPMFIFDWALLLFIHLSHLKYFRHQLSFVKKKKKKIRRLYAQSFIIMYWSILFHWSYVAHPNESCCRYITVCTVRYILLSPLSWHSVCVCWCLIVLKIPSALFVTHTSSWWTLWPEGSTHQS